MNARCGKRVWRQVGLAAALCGAFDAGSAQTKTQAAPQPQTVPQAQERVPTQMRPQPRTREACEALRGLHIEDTTIEVSGIVNAGSFTPPDSISPLRNLPRFCRVIAVTRPAIRFEVWLPLEKWTERFEAVGNGGMAGTIAYGAMAGALRRGNAAASTDTGHVNQPGSGFDASWSLDRPELVVDFAYRALHLTTVHGKRVTAAFYGKAAEHAYYVGCSKGGGQGLMEAQRYPTDFDGIVAGDPAYNWTNLYTGAHLYYSQVMLKDPESYIQPAKVKLLGDAVNKACDGKDGFADGVVGDPFSCRVDLGELACSAGQDPGTCFTPKQIESVKRIWAGAKDDQGRVIFPGLLPGGEAGSGGWQAWVTGSAPRQATHWKAAESFFRYMVMNDEKYDALSFDYDREHDRKILEKLAPMLNADNPDLRPFARRGGKLILYHGLSDPDISPVNTVNFYQRMEDVSGMGTRGFARLFLAPGMQHCGGGPGPDQFDAVSAVERWVEEGMAPEKIIASHLTHGAVDRTRPLCPYPQVAVYSGKGSATDAANFACKVPMVAKK
jgi:feruloyl esterase